MHGAERIQDAALHRHATGHFIGRLRGDFEFDVAADFHAAPSRVVRNRFATADLQRPLDRSLIIRASPYRQERGT
jgi:hypothetical protein